MAHSNSSLNTFTNCMQKYKLCYIDKVQPDTISPHLTFGAMAHEVLEKAGHLRDAVADNVVCDDEYMSVIPSEVLYPELKSYFNITSWNNYFVPVIKQIATYEHNLMTQLLASGDVQIEREVKLQLTPEQCKEFDINNLTKPLVGVIDLLLYTPTSAIIVDYKFSTKRKEQSNFDIDSQLQIYAMLVNKLYDIPLHNIMYGYIDIPKCEFGQPVILSSGKLSRDKSQNVSQDMYKAAVYNQHGDDIYYNCEPGGYYYEIYCNLALNKAAYMQIQYVDEEICMNIVQDILNTASFVETMEQRHYPYLKRYDAYTCKNCEYLSYCKKYLTTNDG